MKKTETFDRVHRTYGGAPPDWIVALARAVDLTSQSHMARELRYSPAAISLLVNNKYRRDNTKIERHVRTYLMKVECPVLGRIEGDVCRGHQAAPYSGANPTSIALYRECHGGCRFSALKPEIRE
jgi:hypothetical protein